MQGEQLSQLLTLINSVLLIGLVITNVIHFATDSRNQITTLVFRDDALEDSRYGSKLALVLPFTAHDSDKLIENIRLWKTFQPCYSPRGYHVFIEVVFYYHKALWNSGGLTKKLKQELEPISHCFAKIRFISADLSEKEDQYPKGPTNMFFKLLSLPSFVLNYNYMYYMEPDNFPCRPYWLDKLYEAATIDGNFWMKGSIIRDGSSLIGTYSFANHINGNAIYRLDSSSFLDYLKRVHYELNQNPEKYVESYDIAIYLVRLNRDIINFAEYAATQHLFVYTEFIQNWYRTAGNMTEICWESPKTYLLHGRNLMM